MIFSFMESVRIISGFYRGYKGYVVNYYENREENNFTYDVKVMINKNEKIVSCKESELREKRWYN